MRSFLWPCPQKVRPSPTHAAYAIAWATYTWSWVPDGVREIGYRITYRMSQWLVTTQNVGYRAANQSYLSVIYHRNKLTNERVTIKRIT